MKWHNIQQNSEAWDQVRLGKVTASNFGHIMANDGGAFGDTAKKYALQVALELATGQKAEHSFSNRHMERGHEQEPVAKMLYENTYFVDVTNGGFFDHSDYGDSPDGLVDDDGVIEIKSVIASTHYATLKRKSFDPAYRWQLIGHLDCTNRDWVDFISYCSDFPEDSRLFVYRLNRSDYLEDIERLRERRSQFIKLVQDVLHNIQSNH
ncbi:lambda exonuclease family protein [Entomomonas asaccharolytica]|uniref:YqaJ viral recombinase family protein n=1 Tax=Entomomonas asaccharolytica TaxID=2785331 RepID=A0A974RXP7_9GAMM|nr:lambda exonuclease family protein [Entomomonas asaccharolytica]QQP85099.1 YqaJ viral recombinase family protein [Entomomonas asaccharolytica]